jgi:hypothetical protein
MDLVAELRGRLVAQDTLPALSALPFPVQSAAAELAEAARA